jgi:hypothetical protein
MTHRPPVDSHSPGTVITDPEAGVPWRLGTKPREEGMAEVWIRGLSEEP